MSLMLHSEIVAARLRVVDDHIRFECAHELDSLMSTFGAEPEWHDRAADEVLNGHDPIGSIAKIKGRAVLRRR